MAPVGRLLLILGFVFSLYGIGASIYGGRRHDEGWIHSGRRTMYSIALIAAVAFVILDVAFIRSDFSYDIVASGSSTTTPFFYRLAAIWATQQGSLLLWVLLLSGWSSLALAVTRRQIREVVPWAQAVLLGMVAFFLGLNVFFANPFATSSPAPVEGAGLDPLLRHTTMMIHPPMLYSGLTLLMIPFAFAVGALISGRLNSEWVSVTRRFALAAWLCLGIGIMLGARWSYTELGWGGFWAWDPVENAALMPWLLATAYIHSIMIQEKRGMLKVWNASLVLLTGTMAIVGDFLVRSGILSSIHAFVSDPTLNFAFVALISVMAIGSFGLVYWRRDMLRTEASIDSLFSREAVFLLQNMLLVALTLVIFWVTFFPLISEALTGNQINVGASAFLPFVDPLAIAIVALAGIGPIIPWRRVTAAKLKRNFVFPVAVGLLTLVALLGVGGVSAHPIALALFCAAAFVVATVVQEFARGTRARSRMAGEAPPIALGRLVRRNRRRYGGYIAHLGVALALVGVAASTSFQHSRDALLKPGQSVQVDGYSFTYVKPFASATAQKLNFGSIVRVTREGHPVTTVRTVYGLYPSQTSPQPIGRFFNSSDGASSESRVGLDAGLTHDIWVDVAPNMTPLIPLINQGDHEFFKAIRAISTLPKARQSQDLKAIFELRDRLIGALTQRWVTHPWSTQFKIIVSPLVTWLWLGAIITALGGLIALWPAPRRTRRRRGADGGGPGAPARVPPEREPVGATPDARELVTRMERTWPAT
jgi:cytochrome c-type biogenesis protein CcmF